VREKWSSIADIDVRPGTSVCEISEKEAQLRWLLLHPALRSGGLGRKLVEEALQFSREAGYSTVFLWTVSTLPAAAGLYRSMGFEERERLTHMMWGREVNDVKYERGTKKR
jgi:GNAT superfamily N-acetyltransferase